MKWTGLLLIITCAACGILIRSVSHTHPSGACLTCVVHKHELLLQVRVHGAAPDSSTVSAAPLPDQTSAWPGSGGSGESGDPAGQRRPQLPADTHLTQMRHAHTSGFTLELEHTRLSITAYTDVTSYITCSCSVKKRVRQWRQEVSLCYNFRNNVSHGSNCLVLYINGIMHFLLIMISIFELIIMLIYKHVLLQLIEVYSQTCQ